MTTLATLLLLISGVCWLFNFSEKLTQALLIADLVARGLLSAAICAMTFRVAGHCYKELKKGRW